MADELRYTPPGEECHRALGRRGRRARGVVRPAAGLRDPEGGGTGAAGGSYRRAVPGGPTAHEPIEAGELRRDPHGDHVTLAIAQPFSLGIAPAVAVEVSEPLPVSDEERSTPHHHAAASHHHAAAPHDDPAATLLLVLSDRSDLPPVALGFLP